MTANPVAQFGVVGNPIAHSQSPFIHQEFARQTGLNVQYDKILAPLDGFNDTVEHFFKSGGRGLNVTVPFKQDAYTLAQAHLSQGAALAAAVNTLWLHDNALHGCNTDGAGLIADLLRLGHAPAGKRTLLLGAGGAARGAIPALLEAGCQSLHIANRTATRAQQLQHDFSDYAARHSTPLTAGALNQVRGAWDLVINATSSSLDTATAFDIRIDYAPTALAYDMAYGTEPTIFMQQAAQQGAHDHADGLGMLVSQAAVSFAIWNGVTPDTAPVLESLRARLSSNDARS